ncbi:MAG: hypothetical protein RLN96_03805, partial [Pseudomonadales bacterium]
MNRAPFSAPDIMNFALAQTRNPHPWLRGLVGTLLACVFAFFTAIPEAQAQGCTVNTDGTGLGPVFESCSENKN